MLAPIKFQKGIWSSLLVVIRVMMINDYNNKTGVIGSNCAFWNGLHGGQVVGRETAASASGSWKDGPNWLKAALLIALARAWESFGMIIHEPGSLEGLWFQARCISQNTSRKENRCSATWQRFNKTLRKITMFTLPLLTSGLEAGRRPVSGGWYSELEPKEACAIQFSIYLTSCCFLLPQPPRIFSGWRRKGNRTRKMLDYEQHMCFKFRLRVGRLWLSYWNILLGVQRSIVKPAHSSMW